MNSQSWRTTTTTTPLRVVRDMMVPGVPGQLNVFTAADEDARVVRFPGRLRGEDADDFVLTNTSVDPTTGLRGPGEPITLRFAAAPDYREPDRRQRRLGLQGHYRGHGHAWRRGFSRPDRIRDKRRMRRATSTVDRGSASRQ